MPPLPCLKRVAWVGKFDGIATCGRSLEPRMAPYSRSLGSLRALLSYNEKSTDRGPSNSSKIARHCWKSRLLHLKQKRFARYFGYFSKLHSCALVCETGQNCWGSKIDSSNSNRNALLVPSDASQNCTPVLSFARRDKIECE